MISNKIKTNFLNKKKGSTTTNAFVLVMIIMALAVFYILFTGG